MNAIWNQIVTFVRLAAEKPWMHHIFEALKKSFIEAVIELLEKKLQGRRGGSGLSVA